MFENMIRKYLGRNEQVLAFLSASWSIVNSVEKSQNYSKYADGIGMITPLYWKN